MDLLTELSFNPKPPTILHIDLNSCFATIEQQANKYLRNKPVVVAAYKTDNGCVVAPSVEAKRLGIKVGMRVRDAKMIYPKVVVLEPDPWKYRNVHLALRKILLNYTDDLYPKSIDEFVLNLEGCPAFKKGMFPVAGEIKNRIKKEIGGYITVSIGISTNRFLAKVASELMKPDGLESIDAQNYFQVYSGLELTDLPGIKTNNRIRLNKQNIFTVLDFYNARAKKLQAAFASVVGYYWYLRLKGWEIDDVAINRRSYGNSVALGKPLSSVAELSPVLMNLVEKMSFRMRKAGYKARGVHLSLLYRNGNYWHKGFTVGKYLFSVGDIYKTASKLLTHSPYRAPVHTIAVTCFDLNKEKYLQTSLLDDADKKQNLTQALDRVKEKWGIHIITPAIMLSTKDIVKDRVAFGGIKELEEFVFKS